MPRAPPGAVAEAVLINTAGGIAGGDTLRTTIAAEPGARLVVTTQAAERAYRARAEDGPATVETVLAVAPGAALDWLPQETILFDGARLHRRLTLALEGDARVTAAETLVFGRRLSGETIRRLDLRDLLRLTRDGAPLLHDATRVEGTALDGPDGLGAASRLGAAGAVATVLHAAPDASVRLAALRGRLGPDAGASLAADGLLVARLLAPSAHALRRALVLALDTLRDGAQPPRLWSL